MKKIFYIELLKKIFVSRYFIWGSVKRDFQCTYKNSLLGATWTVINPLSMIIVYIIIFSNVMHTRLPNTGNKFSYSIYLCAGSLPWGLFQEIITRGQNLFLLNASIIKKVNFPRISLPIIALINSMINFVIIFILFIVFILILGQWPGTVFFAFFPTLLIQIIFSIGLGMILGILNVFFRDVGQLFSVVMQFWFWLTPIVYPANILPDYAQFWLKFNPMFSVINAYQTIFVNQQWPNPLSLLYPFLLGICSCAVGLHLFHKHVGEMVDEL